MDPTRSTVAATKARWAGTTPEQRREATRKMRTTLALNQLRRQIAQSRQDQGLPPHVEAEKFLDELARELLGGGGR